MSGEDIHSGGRCGADEVVYPDGNQHLSWLCDHPFIGLGKRQRHALVPLSCWAPVQLSASHKGLPRSRSLTWDMRGGGGGGG